VSTKVYEDYVNFGPISCSGYVYNSTIYLGSNFNTEVTNF